MIQNTAKEQRTGPDLREEFALFEQVFSQSADLIFQLGTDGFFLRTNPGFARILGWTENELSSITFSDLLHPEDGPLPDEWSGSEPDRSQPVKLARRLRTKNGSYKVIEWTYTTYAHSAMTLGVGRDVTQQTEMQRDFEQTSLLLEKTARITKVGGWEYDVLTKEVGWTAMTREIHNVPPDFVPTAESLGLFYRGEEDRKKMEAARDRAALEGAPWDLELTVTDYNGRQKWIRSMGEAMFENGVLRKLWGTCQDIENQKRTEAQLDAGRKEAENATKAKSVFLANVSHEIRTPLNGVIGFGELMRTTVLDSLQEEYLNILDQSAHSLLGVVNDILDFSKIEAGQMRLDPDWCEIRSVVDGLGKILSPALQKKKSAFRSYLDPQIPRFVWVDAGRLRQVLLNLLGNSVKFTEEGEIFLSIEKIAGTEDQLRFSIKDNGIGISAHERARLFQPFSQGDDSTAKRYGGSGLGLSICNKLLELMGSRLELESESGKGSLFFFDMPALMSDSRVTREENDPAAHRPGIKPPYGRTPFSPKNILIAEDDSVNARLFGTMIDMMFPGVPVQFAKTGLEAVTLMRREKSDLILMDINMPEMDGYEAASIIRKENTDCDPVIIAITASVNPTDQADRCASGINDVVLKPMTRFSLTKTLSRWIKC